VSWAQNSRSAGIAALEWRARGVARCLGLWVLACVLAPAGGAAGAQKKPPAKPIDLNSASAEQLQQLPGIGPSTAESIIRFREKSGPFQRVDDLLVIHGISRAKLEKMRPYLVVKQPAKKSP
jgi:competence ComEA-like helix-hairpin-helix protein